MAEVHGTALQMMRFVPVSQNAPVGPVMAPPDETVEHPGFDMLNAELNAFARCIRDKTPFPVGLDDALHGMAVFDAAVQSAESGGIVGSPPRSIAAVTPARPTIALRHGRRGCRSCRIRELTAPAPRMFETMDMNAVLNGFYE